MSRLLFAFRLLPLAACALLASRAKAISLGDLKPLAYDCQLIMSVTDGAPFYEIHFVAQADGGEHGGGARTFDAGGGYRIDVVADAKWLSLGWSKADKTIARGVFAISEGSPIHRVGMLYNPNNPDELTALTCSRQTPNKFN